MDILNIKMLENDAKAETIGEYLKMLLLKVWKEQEEFDSKRPFGNSGWDYEIQVALVHAGVIDGVIDDGGYHVYDFDCKEISALIEKAINDLFDSAIKEKLNG